MRLKDIGQVVNRRRRRKRRTQAAIDFLCRPLVEHDCAISAKGLKRKEILPPVRLLQVFYWLAAINLLRRPVEEIGTKP